MNRPTLAELGKKTIKELRPLLQERELSTTGVKALLVQRLYDNWDKTSQPSPKPVVASPKRVSPKPVAAQPKRTSPKPVIKSGNDGLLMETLLSNTDLYNVGKDYIVFAMGDYIIFYDLWDEEIFPFDVFNSDYAKSISWSLGSKDNFVAMLDNPDFQSVPDSGKQVTLITKKQNLEDVHDAYKNVIIALSAFLVDAEVPGAPHVSETVNFDKENIPIIIKDLMYDYEFMERAYSDQNSRKFRH